MRIIVTLQEIMGNDYLRENLGYNPYCLAEGADPKMEVELTLEEAKQSGILEQYFNDLEG